MQSATILVVAPSLSNQWSVLSRPNSLVYWGRVEHEAAIPSPDQERSSSCKKSVLPLRHELASSDLAQHEFKCKQLGFIARTSHTILSRTTLQQPLHRRMLRLRLTAWPLRVCILTSLGALDHRDACVYDLQLPSLSQCDAAPTVQLTATMSKNCGPPPCPVARDSSNADTTSS